MQQQSRTLLAIALSMGIIFIYYQFLAPPPAVQNNQNQEKKTASNSDDNQNLKDDSVSTKSPNSASVQEASVPANHQKNTTSLIPLRQSAEELFKLQTKSARISLNKKKAVVESWELLDFHQREEDQKEKQKEGEEAPFVDLLEGGAQAFNLRLNEEDLGANIDYEMKGSDGKTLVFEKQGPGFIVEKKYQFASQNNPHLVGVSINIKNTTSSDLSLNPSLWISRKESENKGGGFLSFLQGPADVLAPSFYKDDTLETADAGDELPELVSQSGKIYWTGLSDRYFLSSLISRQASAKITYGRDGKFLYTSMSYDPFVLKAGQEATRHFSVYLGPKKRESLEKIGSRLEASVDYGWFSIVAVPLLWLLSFFQKLVGNWGLAIILLTFLVKILLHPINKKSMESMKAMQRLQPRLKEIREKFKDNREKLNMEMMQLFKTHKVNPMGGCLPMVLQIPVYIALYRVLWSSVELYEAPFFWFYTDLSAPDPYMISPILLGILMALQQRLMPQATTMEPAQQKVMMIMPLMFSAFMIFFPFGLVLYIMVNTIMTVIQQYMVHEGLSFVGLVKKLVSKSSGKAA